MTRQSLPFVAAVVMALLLCACQNSLLPRLESIESFVEDHPDSAISCLSAIDSNRVRKGKAHAMYTYLTSLGRYKAYIDEYDDSPVADAADYFHRHNDKLREMKSRFLQGYTLYNAGKLNEAIVAYTNAEKTAEELEDNFFAGLCCREMALIFSKTYSPEDHLTYAIKARDFFNKGGYKIHSMYVLKQIGNAYMQKGDYDNALYNYTSSADSARIVGDRVLLTDAMAHIAEILTIQNKSADAIRMYSVLKDSLNYSLSRADFACLARAYAQIGNRNTALLNLEKANESVDNTKQQYYIDLQAYYIGSSLGDQSMALHYLERVFDYVTRDYEYTHNRNSALYTQRDYFIEKNRVEEIKKELAQQRLYTTISFSALLIMFSIIALIELYKKVRRSRQEKEYLVNKIYSLSNKHSDNMKISMRYGMEFFNDLAQLYWQNQPEKILPALKNTISHLGKDEETISRMIENINLTHEDILVRLSEQVPALNVRELKLFCFLVCQINHNAISLITDKSPAAVNSHIYRLRSKIEASEAPDKAEFLNTIS